MGKIRVDDYTSDDWFELDDTHGGIEKIKRKNNGKSKNEDEDGLHESQGLPAGWRKGDSFIGRRRKARN